MSSAAPRFDLYVLGIAQDGGVPHLGCDCARCEGARAGGETLHPASLGIRDRVSGQILLVEATPAIEPQLALFYRLAGVARPRPNPVHAVLLTHAHLGHYLGLAQFGREAAATRALPVFCTASMTAFLRGNAPWSELLRLGHIRPVEVTPGMEFEPLPGLAVTALPVPHRAELADTVAFRFRGPARSALFCPDVDRWEADGAPGLLGRLLDGVEIAYLDGTFHDDQELPGRDMTEIPHPRITGSMDRLETLGVRPGAIRFIHLNHTNPALGSTPERAAMEARGFACARQGEAALL